jgi:sugar phosphate isomerase/epimerase
MTRREWIGALAAGAAFGAPAKVRLSIGNYGMQSLAVNEALALIRKTGYDGAELCLMPGWPSEPARLDPAARRGIREQPLPVATLIENFNLLVSDEAHAATLDRIRAASTLAHEIAPKQPPILQTVLGGRPPEWEQVKDRMASRLAEWARVAEENKLHLAVKSHVSSASDTPEKLLWLLEKVSSPALGGIYDYSHVQLLGLDLEKSLNPLLSRSLFITVKDGKMAAGKAQFLLPGEGTIDYRRYFELLREKAWNGWMLVEISRQLQTAPGYDPAAAARRSYEFLSPLLRQAGLR